MLTTWQKRYHDLYAQLKEEHDPYVIQLISKKEEIILAAPYSYALLKHDFPDIRRFKSGKVRILYALSTEAERFWPEKPATPEIIFLYVDLRNDETYTTALKLLRKHNLVQ